MNAYCAGNGDLPCAYFWYATSYFSMSPKMRVLVVKRMHSLQASNSNRECVPVAFLISVCVCMYVRAIKHMYVCMYVYVYVICTREGLPPLKMGTPSKDISTYLAPGHKWMWSKCMYGRSE